VYKKIKILTKNGEDHATVSIYIYNDDNKNREKVKKLKAVTYNYNEPPTFLSDEKIFTNTINDNWQEVTFTFPNVKPGSVIEYQYDLESEFFFNFTGWTFQSDIPKVYSEFHALIPGNWVYNRHLNGLIPLNINDSTIKKNCFSLTVGSTADCEELTYAMKDIPAFVEEEKYSTAKSNYLSKIKFELAKIIRTDGTEKNFTSDWKETDLKLKHEEGIGRQLNDASYYSKNLPASLFENDDPIKKAKAIYTYMQHYFSLNTKNENIYRDVDSKKAFKEGIGSASEINIALINALQSAKIPAEIMLISTRDNGYPTKLHPVMTEFNYVLAHVTINGKVYLLDASDKKLAFGMIPLKALNGYGRVLDFDNGSYWFDINADTQTYKRQVLFVKMNEDATLEGKIKETSNGYFSKQKRESIQENQVEYLNSMQNENKNLEVLEYQHKNLDELEEPLIEEFDIKLNSAEIVANNIYISPFLNKHVKNPFQLKKRSYPVDFGFTVNESFIAEIEIPENYRIIALPKAVSLKLPNNGGTFISAVKIADHKITIFNKVDLKKTVYSPQEYPYLKELFNQIIITENSLITLEKIL
jgi:transglutaminase-like putative cysteine protease